MSVKVDDEIIKGAGEQIKAFGEAAEGIFDRYLDWMKYLYLNGIKSGESSENIKAFVESITAYKYDISEITKRISEQCENYITDLDAADDFVY